MKSSSLSRNPLAILLLASAIATLVGCGGGASSATSNLIGTFIDDPVSGLTYSCTNSTTTTNGLTDSQGNFSYPSGATCIFKVGNVTLGTATAVGIDGKVTPQDVASVARSATSANSAVVIAQFLQSLHDGSATGKIVIPTATNTALSNVTAVTLVSNSGVASQETLQTLVSAVDQGKALVTANAATTALDLQRSRGVVSDSAGTVSTSNKTLNSITVTSSKPSNAAGRTENFVATGTYSDGTTQNLTDQVTWSSSNTSAVSITSAGVATGSGQGASTITASLKPTGSAISISGSLLQTTTAAVLDSIAISNTASPPAGKNDQLAATGTYSDGSTKDLTNQVSWTSTDESKVVVSSTGLASGVAKGSSTITASLTPTGSTNAISTTKNETVLDPTITNLVISYIESGLTVLKQGATTALKAIATLSNNATQIVSSLVDWIVTPAAGSNGAVTIAKNTIDGIVNAILSATAVGDVSLSASYLGSSSNSLTLKVEPNNLIGTVATGAPVGNATINVVDSKGITVGTGTSDSTGAYTITISSTATPPFVIKASGIIGDATSNLYSVTGSVGTANVSQVTTAIAATLSTTGNPSDTFNNAGNSNLSAERIQAVDTAYSQAFSNLTSSPTSFINSSFNNNMDAALDNIKVEIKTSGKIVIATTSNLASNDLSTGSSNSSQLQSLTIQKGQLPSGTASAQLIASTPLLTVTDLEGLRSKLQTCFASSASSRGTPSSPIANCADSNFVVTSDITAANGFKHSGFKWNNSNWNNSSFNPSAANTAFHYGLFGYALTNSTLDNAVFLQPKIIRPLDQLGISWIVQFPIQLASGALTSFGDSAGNKFLVVKKISSLTSSIDTGYRLVGDQRDYLATITPTVQKMVKQSGTDYQTGFNLVFKKLSSTDNSNRKAVLANIKGKGLPTGGIYLAQNDPSCGTTVNASLAISFLNNVSYNGSALNESTLASNPNNLASIQTTDICTGVFRMSETGNENAAIALRSWGSDGNSIAAGGSSAFTYQGSTTAGGEWLSDNDLSAIGSGEPYNITIWLSDGSTVNYVNRLPTSMLSLADARNYPDYPDFTTATKTAFLSYAGTSGFQSALTANSNIYTYQVGMFWNGSSTSSINNLAPSSASTTLACGSNCLSGNWAPGAAMLKAFARTVDSLAVSTQYWNY
ncbi:Ig-like domain-containing protein [Limnohabitans sp. B9-3]|uniref:beta strand repeat-containing protein n=1 Tax=Limnohabitans sp. B9-3 TaxID=1100707 RepID=UPI000C1DF6AF|nr:Ig-like domain-containing protein [Limnohabitans sp. B9-3]PIT71237.1 hypothetical protein B9Z42_15990 [Limnohabitans sp. B9-3]